MANSHETKKENQQTIEMKKCIHWRIRRRRGQRKEMRIMIERKENKQNWHKNRIIFAVHTWDPANFACVKNGMRLCFMCAAIDSRNKSNWHRLLLFRMATVSSFLNNSFFLCFFLFFIGFLFFCPSVFLLRYLWDMFLIAISKIKNNDV